MSLRQTILEVQKLALKQGEKAALNTLRLLWSGIRNAEIDQGTELNDEEIVQLITRQVKQLKDALTDFQKAGRADLIQQAETEIQLLSQYLPQQMTEAELESAVRKVMTSLPAGQAGALGEKNMGVIMGLVMKEVKGKADGQRVRECVERLLVS